MRCGWSFINSLEQRAEDALGKKPKGLVPRFEITFSEAQKILSDLRALRKLEEHDARMSPELCDALEALVRNFRSEPLMHPGGNK